MTPRERRAFVFLRDRLHDLPEGLTGLVPTRLGPLARSSLLSPAGKARVALDYVLPAQPRRRRRVARSLHSAATGSRSLGTVSRAADVRYLRRRRRCSCSLTATFPQLREAERVHGGLIRGVLAGRRDAPATLSATIWIPDPNRRPRASWSPCWPIACKVEGVTIRTGVEVKAVGA